MKIRFLILALLTALATIIMMGRFNGSLGIDFYQYWGVGKAQEWSPSQLKSPAAEQERYAAVLNAQAARPADRRFVEANKIRHELQLVQTPLCYSIFTLMPANFSLAFGLFQIIQGILFLAAILILSEVYFGNWLKLLPYGLLLAVSYEPLISDLRVGNLNTVYLFGFASLLLLADRSLRKHSPRQALGASILFMIILVFLALLKPNWDLAILLLAVYLWVGRGKSVFVSTAAAGVVSGAVFVLLPCIQFHSWMVWQDWYRYLRTWNGASMLARIPEGNYSAVLLFSQIIGSSILTGTILLGLLMAISIFIALMVAKEKEESFGKGLARAAIRCFTDPHLIIAVGVTLTLLVYYFAWLHYYTLSLLPAFWLLSPRYPWRYGKVAGFVSIIFTSNFIETVREWFGLTYIISYITVIIGLLPLWAGILAAIASPKNRPLSIPTPCSDQDFFDPRGDLLDNKPGRSEGRQRLGQVSRWCSYLEIAGRANIASAFR